MRGVNDRNFFNAWQILCRATCPNATESARQVGDVEWRRERHSFFGSSYVFSFEVHLLRRSGRGGGWLLMVVIENRWNEKHYVLKTATWARVISRTSLRGCEKRNGAVDADRRLRVAGLSGRGVGGIVG
jgi:hypothetical protein